MSIKNWFRNPKKEKKHPWDLKENELIPERIWKKSYFQPDPPKHSNIYYQISSLKSLPSIDSQQEMSKEMSEEKFKWICNYINDIVFNEFRLVIDFQSNKNNTFSGYIPSRYGMYFSLPKYLLEAFIPEYFIERDYHREWIGDLAIKEIHEKFRDYHSKIENDSSIKVNFMKPSDILSCISDTSGIMFSDWGCQVAYGLKNAYYPVNKDNYSPPFRHILSYLGKAIIKDINDLWWFSMYEVRDISRGLNNQGKKYQCDIIIDWINNSFRYLDKPFVDDLGTWIKKDNNKKNKLLPKLKCLLSNIHFSEYAVKTVRSRKINLFLSIIYENPNYIHVKSDKKLFDEYFQKVKINNIKENDLLKGLKKYGPEFISKLPEVLKMNNVIDLISTLYSFPPIISTFSKDYIKEFYNVFGEFKYWVVTKNLRKQDIYDFIVPDLLEAIDYNLEYIKNLMGDDFQEEYKLLDKPNYLNKISLPNKYFKNAFPWSDGNSVSIYHFPKNITQVGFLSLEGTEKLVGIDEKGSPEVIKAATLSRYRAYFYISPKKYKYIFVWSSGYKDKAAIRYNRSDGIDPFKDKNVVEISIPYTGQGEDYLPKDLKNKSILYLRGVFDMENRAFLGGQFNNKLASIILSPSYDMKNIKGDKQFNYANFLRYYKNLWKIDLPKISILPLRN